MSNLLPGHSGVVPAHEDLIAHLVRHTGLSVGESARVVADVLAYHAALVLDRVVDRPRNLAKSVTVE